MKYSIIPILIFLASCSSVKKTTSKIYEKKDSAVRDTTAQISKHTSDTVSLKKTIDTDESTIVFEFNKPDTFYHLKGTIADTGYDPSVYVPSEKDLAYILGNDYEGADKLTKIVNPHQSLKSITIIKKHTAQKTDSSTGRRVDTAAITGSHEVAVKNEKKETAITKKKTSIPIWFWFAGLLVLGGVGYAWYKKNVA